MIKDAYKLTLMFFGLTNSLITFQTMIKIGDIGPNKVDIEKEKIQKVINQLVSKEVKDVQKFWNYKTIIDDLLRILQRQLINSS